MARLTIGIPCYNEAAYVRDCLESVFAQDCAAEEVRVVVSDNVSTDATRDLIRAALDAAPPDRRAGVTVLEQPRNIGAAANFWAVYDACQTEFFMWLGGHDRLTPDFVSATLPLIADDRTVAMASGMPFGVRDAGPAVIPVRDAVYDFSDPDPLRRYLDSVRRLNNCTVFHAIFRHSGLADLTRSTTKPFDHLVISHLLGRGILRYSQAGYVRRYFSAQRPQDAARLVDGFYDMAFFEAYLQDFETVFSDRLPPRVLRAVSQVVFTELANRFGLPAVPLKAAQASKRAEAKPELA